MFVIYFSVGGLIAEPIDTVHLGKSAVSKEEIINILAPSNKTKALTRSLRIHGDQKTNSMSKALSVEIYFDHDSSKLSEAARQQLVPYGEALSSERLATLKFILEGHTDTTGPDEYNLDLSEKRAKAVKDHFVKYYQVSAERIATIGKGEKELKDPINPKSGSNRRVTIISL